MIKYNFTKKITIIYLILSVVVILVHGGVGVVVLRVLRLVLHDLEVPGSLEVVAVLLPGGPDPVGLPDVCEARNTTSTITPDHPKLCRLAHIPPTMSTQGKQMYLFTLTTTHK